MRTTLMRKVAGLVVLGGLALLFAALDAKAQEASPAPPAAEAAKPAAEAAPAAEGPKKFTLASELVGQTKFWLPSTIIVDQGDKVELTLKNEVPGQENQHGFSIPAYGIVTLVTRGEPKKIEFTADKVGVFPYICQVHAAHVGGQLVVHPKHKGMMMEHHSGEMGHLNMGEETK